MRWRETLPRFERAGQRALRRQANEEKPMDREKQQDRRKISIIPFSLFILSPSSFCSRSLSLSPSLLLTLSISLSLLLSLSLSLSRSLALPLSLLVLCGQSVRMMSAG